MKKVIWILGILIVAGFTAKAFFFSEEEFLSVLIFSKTEQFRHESIEAGQEAIKALGKKHGFEVSTSEDAAIFNEDDLQKYNVVIFLNTTGDILNNAQQLELNRFLQAGGGFVGIHAACDTEYGWPWYGKLVGAYFDGHPNDPNVREADIQVVDKAHASTEMLEDIWHRSDEWYNYKDINPDINVLMNLDETSYEGGTNGDNHPIAWYHEYDGGRSWYTGLGHTPETFAEPLFLEHLWGGITYAAGPKKRLDFSTANVAPEGNRFEKVVLENNLNEPMELDILPNGNLIYIQRDGAVKIFDTEKGSSSVIQEIEVFSELEDGLLGLALDPNVEENRWVYLFYSLPEINHQRIGRFTMNESYDKLDMDSEKILLEFETQRDECCHSAGSMEFGSDGILFVSTGDNTNPRASDGFAPIDERDGRSPWDAQKSSANSMDLRGKVLRIKPEDDGTYSIPEGNLFEDETVGRPEIYVMGCRNPYRISVDKRTNYLYWGDVGPDGSKDGEDRGSKGYDEVNQARAAGFFGWPYFIGDNKPYNKYDFAQQVSYKPFDAKKPENLSPNNSGMRILPEAQPAFIWYPYGTSEEFPLTGEGARNAMAGPVFYADDYPETEARFPTYYDGKLFTYDWMRGWIMAVTMDEEGNFKRMERFLPDLKLNNPIDIIMGPKGDMYLLEYGSIWFSENEDARLIHLTYTGGNRKPIAKIGVDKAVGAAPLTVQFDGEVSVDYDGDELVYKWDFDGTSSTDATPEYTFDKPGVYPVTLSIEDPSGEVSETEIEILVGNDLPKIAWNFTGNRSFFWGDSPLEYEISLVDQEDGELGSGITPSEVAVSIDYLERGYDENEIAMGHMAIQEASAFMLGKQLMEKSDCSICHQIETKSVGPTYQQVANKYKDDASAVEYLSKKIINGGSGVWGEVAMAAHPQLSTGEAEQMARYILSLSGEGEPKGLPTKGIFIFEQHTEEELEGKYIFTASYTDKGGQEIGPLTARETFTLQQPYLTPAKVSEMKKVSKFTIEPEMSQGMLEEAMDILIGSDGGYVAFEGLDLTGIKSLNATILKAGPYFKGGRVSFRLDSPTGEIIAETEIKTSITDFGPDNFMLNVKEIAGVHDLYITFENEDGDSVTAFAFIYLDNKVAQPES
ncbi:MAG: ThuA domain-containing protein [Bacteroidota bacterium]